MHGFSRFTRGPWTARLVAGSLMLGLAAAVQAGVIATPGPGTGAPPAVLGGHAMTAFPADGRPLLQDVSDVSAPGGGVVGFSPSLNHRQIGSGWSTWSHGYTGDVYYTNGASAATLTLPANTYAFYFYAEPNDFGAWTITATTANGAHLTKSVVGLSGAQFFGFYGTDGDTLSTIAITADGGANGFAIGEFGIARGAACEGLNERSDVGTAAPPGSLGGYAMTAFPADARPLSQQVFDVAAPGGGTVDFCPELTHVRIGQGWATWSHGYLGDVYYTNEDQATLTLPGGTFAFYFYVEPNSFSTYTISAVANDGSSITQSVNGSSGAKYYGFYSCSGATTIERIVITAAEAANGFAVGEFAINRLPQCSGIGADLSPGTDGPPATLGGYDVIPFMPDPRGTYEDVTWVNAPGGGAIFFDELLSLRRIGDGWATWSHDYAGEVYYNETTEVTVTLPAGTYAFYLYAEPDPFSPIQFLVRANDGTEASETVNGSAGAQFFGFYSCNGSVMLTSVTVSAATDFAIGEFGIAREDRDECGIMAEWSVGTAAPPASLGGYNMAAFGDDTRPVIQDVSDVEAPGGGIVDFTPVVSHRQIGTGWSTWSHGYAGDVYYRAGNDLLLTMPLDTYAFYFYAEPNLFGSYTITAMASDGTTLSQNVEGSAGATYYGFYACNGRTPLVSIEIDADPAASGFAVGEFGIARFPREAVVGDMNCDGLLNAFDIDPFVLALTDEAGYEAAYPCCYLNAADINGDGAVNAFDIDPFVELLAG